MSHVSRRCFLAAATYIVAAAGCGAAATAEIISPVPGKRVALRGYDPVSYFTVGRPEQGWSEFWFAFDDTVYFFKSAEHRSMFAADPERYAPQFDAYCTMKLAMGEKVEADPEAWVIADGKLYVFGRKEAVPRFTQDPAGAVHKANANWQILRPAQ